MHSDTILVNIPTLLSRKRLTNGKLDPVTIEEISDTYLIPLKFFEDNGLTTRKEISDCDQLPPDLVLRADYFTNEGLMLFADGYQKWLRAYERRTPEKRQDFLRRGDVSILRRGLDRIRDS